MMKLAFPFLLISSLLLLSASATEAADTDAVLDMDGHELKRGTEYYILQSPGIGGGLALASRNGTCPLYVVKESSGMGLPVSFYPADPAENTVRLSRDANFVFTASTTCAESTVWQVVNHPDESVFRLFVTTGGVVGNPGRETLSNWFDIRKVEDGSNSRTYKLVYCPGVCNICRPYCGELGLFVEGGKAWLGVRGSPLSVVFKKASGRRT